MFATYFVNHVRNLKYSEDNEMRRLYFQGQLGSASPSPSQQQARGNAQYYSSPRQGEMSTAGAPPGSFSSYHIGSVPSGVYGLQRDNVFPERPNEPECQFYMKTGDCKFGPVCRFHHPRERTISIPDCMLSSLGLPLRPVRYSHHN